MAPHRSERERNSNALAPRNGAPGFETAHDRSSLALSATGRSGEGFTILELALTLVAVTIVAALAIHAWFGRTDVTLRNAADLLAEDLRRMQTHAALQRTPVEVHFHADGGGYHGQHVKSGTIEGTRRYPMDAVFEDVRVSSVRVANGGNLSFDPQGRASSDATITLIQRGVACSVVVDASAMHVAVEGE
jgi:Tfp pilus assembly protein FimT